MAGKILFLIPLIVSFHAVIFAQEDECADSFDDAQSHLLTNECGPWEYKFIFETYESNPLLPNLHGSSYYMTTNPSGPSCMFSELISVEPGSSFEIEFFVSNPDESIILQPCSFDIIGDKVGGGRLPMDDTGSWKTITLPEADPILSPSNIGIKLQCPQMRGSGFIAFGRIHIKGMNGEDCPIASPTTTEPSTTAMETTTDIPDSSTVTNDPTSTIDDVTSTTEDLTTTSDDTTIVTTDPTSTTDDVTSTTEDLTTTSDDTTIVTTDPPSTTDDVTSTTEDLTTTSDDSTLTTDDPTSTTDDLTTTSDDTTIVTTDPTSTTDDVTSTTENLTTTSDDSTLATDDPTSTTDDLTPTLDAEISTMSSESSTDTTTENSIITTTDDLPEDSPSNFNSRRRTLSVILLSFGVVNTLWMAILILYYIFKTPVDKTNPKKMEENITLPRLQVQKMGSEAGSWITGTSLK